MKHIIFTLLLICSFHHLVGQNDYDYYEYDWYGYTVYTDYYNVEDYYYTYSIYRFYYPYYYPYYFGYYYPNYWWNHYWYNPYWWGYQTNWFWYPYWYGANYDYWYGYNQGYYDGYWDGYSENDDYYYNTDSENYYGPNTTTTTNTNTGTDKPYLVYGGKQNNGGHSLDSDKPTLYTYYTKKEKYVGNDEMEIKKNQNYNTGKVETYKPKPEPVKPNYTPKYNNTPKPTVNKSHSNNAPNKSSVKPSTTKKTQFK